MGLYYLSNEGETVLLICRIVVTSLRGCKMIRDTRSLLKWMLSRVLIFKGILWDYENSCSICREKH